MPVTVQDLPERADGRFLYCEACGAQFSATRGDYFWKPADEPFMCCDEPMALARERRLIELQP